MESPVVIDKPPEYHGNAKDSERGFPFDEEESGAWSELAARHPDIAARLRQRPATWARKRRPSSQDHTDDFGDSFGGFDRFPFEDIPQEFRGHFPTHWGRRFGSRDSPPPASPPQSPQQNSAATQTERPGPSGPSAPSATCPQPHLPQYGLRNTVDLGQKSPADPSLVDADERGQRSMSAPPESRPVDPAPKPKMSAQNHPEPPPHPEQPASNVRHIPIFVEGRDEPVINRNVDHGVHYEPKPPPPPNAEREYFPDDGPAFHPPPNFSRAFGTPFNKGFRQGPQPFVQQKVYPQTAFARGASPQRSQSPKPAPHDEHYVKVPVHHSPPPPAAPRRSSPPSGRQAHPPAPPQRAPTAPPAPAPAPEPKQQPSPSNDPISFILSIQTDVLNLMSDVENFTGTKKDKRYLYLDEMLTRNLIKLDNVETEGKENIRQARKEAIRCIQKCIAVLEAKAEKGSKALEQPGGVDTEGAATTEERQTENGVEADMKEPTENETEAAQSVQQSVQSEQKEESKVQGNQETEAKESAEPQAADTRPDENSAPEQNTENKKDPEVLDNNVSPKKGTKNIKKRDKSKDKKESTQNSDKEPTAEEQKAEVMQIDDKGDKTQAMDVDGAASQ